MRGAMSRYARPLASRLGPLGSTMRTVAKATSRWMFAGHAIRWATGAMHGPRSASSGFRPVAVARGWRALNRLSRSGAMAGGVTGLAVALAVAAPAQTDFSIPLDKDGNPDPPPGVTIERTGVIDTLAGTGWQGYDGDGGPAAGAAFRFPRGVAADVAGNVYVADPRDHRIRKIDAMGMISTLAGSGERGYSGDAGPAAEARLDHPEGVAVDTAGNVYVADSANHRIRRIDATGMITTLAGSGERGYSGDARSAAEARLAYPADVAADASGNVYVADSWNHCVRKIDGEGMITTLAGRGFPGYSGDGGQASRAFLANPTAVAVDASGNVYVADNWNHRVRKIDRSGTISTLAGKGWQDDSGDGGPATAAALAYPVSVAAGPEGRVFVATYSFETLNHRVRQIDSSGMIAAYAGTGEEGYEGDGGPASESRLAYPTGIAADAAGNVYIADSRNARIRVVRPGWEARVPLGQSGEVLAFVVDVEAGGVLTLGGGPVAPGRRVAAENGNTYTLTAGPGGGVLAEYVPETQRLRIGTGAVALTRQENGTWRIGDQTVENGHRYSTGGREYVLELANGQWGLPEFVIETAAGKTEVLDGVAATDATLWWVYGVAADATGNVYVSERTRDRILKIDLAGVMTTFAGTGNWGFSGDGGPATAARLRQPTGIAVDEAGRGFRCRQREQEDSQDRHVGGDHDDCGGRPVLQPTGRWVGDGSMAPLAIGCRRGQERERLRGRPRGPPDSKDRLGRNDHDHCRNGRGGLRRRRRARNRGPAQPAGGDRPGPDRDGLHGRHREQPDSQDRPDRDDHDHCRFRRGGLHRGRRAGD